jgi:hypothetical protein
MIFGRTRDVGEVFTRAYFKKNRADMSDEENCKDKDTE